MKKIISLILAVLMLFSVATVAFAGLGTYQEWQANKHIRVYCTNPNCEGVCRGTFEDTNGNFTGCNCCEECPNRIDATGVPINLTSYLDCALGCYYDVDIYEYDSYGNIVIENGQYKLRHKGTYTTVYYWKAKCCEECTGKVGCKCNNTDYKNPCGCPCCFYEPDHTADKIQDGVESAQEGYTKGIQGALLTMRKVMYDLFDKLFQFLRIDVILGKKPSETV